jgi:hypothetical protein
MVRVECFDRQFNFQPERITLVDGRGKELSPSIRAHLSYSTRTLSGAHAIEVELRVDEGTEELHGILQGFLVLEVGHPQVPEFRVPFSGLIRPRAKPDSEEHLPVTGGKN